MRSKNKTFLLGFCICLCSAIGLAQDQHSDHTLEVSRALPAELIEGPHYRVVDPVINIFALDQFKIESDFGDFEAHGQLMLRIRIREIIAIATLKEHTASGTAMDSLAREGAESVKSMGNLVVHPIKSAKGIAAGIGQRFKKFGRDIKADIATATSTATSEEKSLIYRNRWLGVDKAKRRLAAELNIDPYSENPVLQAELERVALTDASATIGSKILVLKLPKASFAQDMYQIITSYDYEELLAYNKKRLRKLGMKKNGIDYFLSMDAYNPTSISLLISLIQELDGVENQRALFDQALATDSSVDALFFIESVVMAVWYHRNQAPLKKMLLVTGLPAAETADHDVIVFAATDFPHWTHVQSDVVKELDVAYKPISPRPKLFLAGNASGEFKREVEDMGWDIRIQVRNEYLPSIPWAVQDEEILGSN